MRDQKYPHFYPRCYADRGIAMANYPSVCLSVTLRYCDHIGWNSLKIISLLLRLGSSLSTDPNIRDHLQRNTLKFWPE